ncbi:hypothetical protein T310_3341 [Rasamsonia emersonii CBS 393.64]|uniref:HNH nuclease domain-containing protein n=1 Tax=Rasamsonia emersonii (strain ATCC 16479 / CBS 393.64 / IMI 116815) TaxID=1408163 RepID=A0A0F4YWR8_RASE3|nr:hypothetical protein T310_3341 [Rasamsonia emersonii CBS 393.64]KKA22659.1 hypothetical protein T310_3341 [Rasamsonia emersonii CBS 393.64]
MFGLSLLQLLFLEMLNVIFTARGGFHTCRYGSAIPLAATNQVLQHGRYILSPITPGEQIHINDEHFYPRTLSLSSTNRETAFRDQVRQRDRRCVITGDENYEAVDNRWAGFEVAHIFPLALDQIFVDHGYAHFMTHNHPPGVNSPQNGLLLRSDIHKLWDDYSIAVNPNDGYRVQSFRPNAWKYHNNVLHPTCRQPGHPQRVIDALLRWHFEQAVLCNMRGAGEASFEFDFPPGTDMMGEIRQGPQAAQRMEAELFSRLYGWYDAESPGPEEKSHSHTPGFQ